MFPSRPRPSFTMTALDAVWHRFQDCQAGKLASFTIDRSEAQLFFGWTFLQAAVYSPMATDGVRAASPLATNTLAAVISLAATLLFCASVIATTAVRRQAATSSLTMLLRFVLFTVLCLPRASASSFSTAFRSWPNTFTVVLVNG